MRIGKPSSIRCPQRASIRRRWTTGRRIRCDLSKARVLVNLPLVGRSERGTRSGWGAVYVQARGTKEIARARELRRDSTEVEERLWWKLLELRGYHFRRQAPFRSYVLDFVEHGARLVIELDGSQHGEDAHRARDEKRDGLP